MIYDAIDYMLIHWTWIHWLTFYSALVVVFYYATIGFANVLERWERRRPERK